MGDRQETLKSLNDRCEPNKTLVILAVGVVYFPNKADLENPRSELFIREKKTSGTRRRGTKRSPDSRMPFK